MPGTIVVGFDGSPASSAAVDWAVLRAQRLACDVNLVWCMPDAWGPGTPRLAREAHETAVGALDAERARISSSLPPTAVHATVKQGEVAELLDELSVGAAMVVVGRDKPGGAHGEGFGAVVLPLVIRSACTVAVIPRTTKPGSGVVVGVDGGPESERALRVAAGEAAALRQPLTIVHSTAGARAAARGKGKDRSGVDLSSESDRILVAAATAVDASYPHLAVDRVLDTRKAAAEALAAAAEGAALLVVGSRGREAVKHMNPGAIGSLVLARIDCPMVVTKGTVGDRLPGRR
ncbi:universal stress protein [Specibacter sp. NPDC078692]|uniref:universal stress protein n=1 Tax=Specibacter sp. NPDC078692 TaxID=3155818 RepID=UPI003435DF01